FHVTGVQTCALPIFKNSLNLCKNSDVKRFFFSSSSEVYGEPVTIPQNEETTPLNSRVPYAVVKNVGEAFCRSYQQEYGLNYTVTSEERRVVNEIRAE